MREKADACSRRVRGHGGRCGSCLADPRSQLQAWYVSAILQIGRALVATLLQSGESFCTIIWNGRPFCRMADRLHFGPTM
eukprot:6208618-Pleurochrysis_carterae.AAC.3